MGQVRVELLPEAIEDLEELDGSSRKMIFKALRKLEVDPEKRGGPLGSGLTTFRKLVVGDRQFRIVYRVDSDGTVVVVWVIASRVDSQCYELAMARLVTYRDREISGELRALLADLFGRMENR
ncbi:type II toxin-antitoxin system RelE/ParE family toxin [Nocardia vinacea]|uniref:type II toxin-antitoxin system RelE family toxin n=1 Tax=Nocardia vinacea TaxID=96468 RepID=UPI00343A6D64